MERTQFTFYESFYKALSRIRKDADRAKAYDAITRFALYGEEPDVDTLPDNVAIAFEVIRPNLEASRRKAEGGSKGKPTKDTGKITGRPKKDNGKIAERTSKQEKEQEKEKEQVQEQMLPPIVPQGTAGSQGFDRFWDVYPKKVGKEAARKAFAKVKAPTDTLITAVEAQKHSPQWQKNNGQFIPNPATWLNQERWEDAVEVEIEDDYSWNPFLQIMKEEHEKNEQGADGGGVVYSEGGVSVILSGDG